MSNSISESQNQLFTTCCFIPDSLRTGCLLLGVLNLMGISIQYVIYTVYTVRFNDMLNLIIGSKKLHPTLLFFSMRLIFLILWFAVSSYSFINLLKTRFEYRKHYVLVSVVHLIIELCALVTNISTHLIMYDTSDIAMLIILCFVIALEAAYVLVYNVYTSQQIARNPMNIRQAPR